MHKNVLHVALLLTINGQTHVSKLVPHWQVPAYEAKFGDGVALDRDSHNQVIATEFTDASLNEAISVMESAIGRNAENGQPWWELAYGSGIGGKKALRDAMLSEPTEYTLQRDLDMDVEESLSLTAAAELEAENAKLRAEAEERAASATKAQAEADALRAELDALKKAVGGVPAKEPSGDGGNGDPLADVGKKGKGKA